MMKSYTVRIQGEIFPVDSPDAASSGEIALRIVKCIGFLADGARFRAVSGNIVDFFFDVEAASSPLDAVLAGANTLRSAAHHAMVSTEGWPEAGDWDSYLDERAVEAFEKVDPAVEASDGRLALR